MLLTAPIPGPTHLREGVPATFDNIIELSGMVIFEVLVDEAHDQSSFSRASLRVTKTTALCNAVINWSDVKRQKCDRLNSLT